MSIQTLKIKGKSFTEKHGEIWKFIKWSFFTGVGASGIELVVHMLLLNFVFVSLLNVPVTNELLLYIRITNAGYMYAFFISSTLGYSIAFILNRKLTFKADANAVLSVTFAFILIVFNIFASTWLGSVLSSVSIANQWGSMGDAVIKVITMIIPSIWIYPANRFIIHRVKKKPAE
jgi:putative flippase GtrA